jgi:hypothetical protein
MYITKTVKEASEILPSGLLRVTVAFNGNNGETEMSQNFVASSYRNLQEQIESVLGNLNAVLADQSRLVRGATIADLEVVEPTDEQLAERALRDAKAAVAELLELKSLGVTVSDKVLTDATSALSKAAESKVNSIAEVSAAVLVP